MDKKDENKKVEKESKKEKKTKENKLIEDLTNQVSELKEKNMRISADMINTIRRKDEENARILKYANEDILKELLNICDNFERAFDMDDENKDDEVSKFLEGMKMIYNSILKILEVNEVKEIEALGKEFDANYHQAVMTESIEGKKENEIIEVMQKGYTYKDKVIRPAMVKVNK